MLIVPIRTESPDLEVPLLTLNSVNGLSGLLAQVRRPTEAGWSVPRRILGAEMLRHALATETTNFTHRKTRRELAQGGCPGGLGPGRVDVEPERSGRASDFGGADEFCERDRRIAGDPLSRPAKSTPILHCPLPKRHHLRRPVAAGIGPSASAISSVPSCPVLSSPAQIPARSLPSSRR